MEMVPLLTDVLISHFPILKSMQVNAMCTYTLSICMTCTLLFLVCFHASILNTAYKFLIAFYHVSDSCLLRLYVMAFTSGVSGASSDSSHGIQIQYNGAVKTMALYDRPGDDYMSNKDDLWELSLSGCIKFRDIQRVSIVASGNDRWNIESIYCDSG